VSAVKDANNNNNNNNNLKFGDIKGETESTIVAAQDQAISTNYFNPLKPKSVINI
jgi:hypothetical protein